MLKFGEFIHARSTAHKQVFKVVSKTGKTYKH